MLAVFSMRCGAPTKSAGDVSSMFEGSDQKLGVKMASLCASLLQSQKQPSLQGFKLNQQDCSGAGQLSQNAIGLKEVAFAGFDAQTIEIAQSKGEKIIHFDVRAQLWLNKTLLGFASVIGELLNKKSADGSTAANSTVSPTADSGLEAGKQIANAQITMVKPVAFNMAAKEFSATARVATTPDSIIALDHTVDVNGKIMNDSIVVTILSQGQQPLEVSLFQDIKIVAFVVPYASDIYIDVSMTINAHSFGVDALFENKLREAMSGLIKKGMDLLASAK